LLKFLESGGSSEDGNKKFNHQFLESVCNEKNGTPLLFYISRAQLTTYSENLFSF
jgi:hypothetical protein